MSTTLPAQTESTPFLFARTKLRPPRLRADTLPRPRLVETIRRSVANARLALVSAPAGYGKTTLVANAVSQLPETKVAWVTLDSDDNDLTRFLYALVSTLQPVLSQFALAATSILSAGRGEQRDPKMLGRAVMTTLVNDLFEEVTPICIVIDDLHYVSNEIIHTTLNFLIERLPPHVTVVIATRHDPTLALSQLRARREMVEIRLDQLRFTADETTALWHQHLGIPLTADELATLMKRTEGWPAGMTLLSASLGRLETQSARNAFLNQLKRSNRFVFDYLAESVFDREEAVTQEFLIATSILDELSFDLCAAVSGRADAGEILDDLYRRNLFLIGSETGEEASYRYHDLFRDFLRERTQRQPAERLCQWHHKAAQAIPQPVRKIQHFLLAEAYEEAATVIERVGQQVVEQGSLAQLHDWVERLPQSILIAHPNLALLMGMSARADLQILEAKRWSIQARSGFAAAGDVEGETGALALLADCLASMTENEAAAQVIAEALSRPLTPTQHIVVLAAQAQLVIDSANVQLALANYDEAITLAESQPTPATLHLLAVHLHSDVMIEPQSTPLAERMARLFVNHSSDNLMLAGMAHVWQAWANLGRGNPSQAVEESRQALEISQQLGGIFNILSESFGLPVWLAFLGRQAEAEVALARLTADLNRPSLAGFIDAWRVAYSYEIGRAKWNLRLEVETQALYNQLLHLRNSNERSNSPILYDLLHGMMLLSAHKYQEAADLFVRASTHPRVTVYYGQHAQALLAHCHYQQGEYEQAREIFTPILARFAAEDTPGHVWNIGARIIEPLLTLAVKHDVQADFARSILALISRPSSASLTPTSATLTSFRIPDTGEILTEREIDVLRLIARGADNATIATEMIVSINTVKTHVAHILGKMGVPSRMAAAIKARELGVVK